MPQRWQEDLRQIGAQVWWEPAQTGGHLQQWTRRHGRSLTDTLTTVIEVLATLLALPVLPRTMPPSGSVVAAAARS